MIRGEGYGLGVFLGKKSCLAKCVHSLDSAEKQRFARHESRNTDEWVYKKWWKIVCSANCKKWKVCSQKLAEKRGYWGGGICLFLCLRGKKGLVLARSEKKKVCTGGKNIAPPPHISSGSAPKCWTYIAVRTTLHHKLSQSSVASTLDAWTGRLATRRVGWTQLGTRTETKARRKIFYTV